MSVTEEQEAYAAAEGDFRNGNLDSAEHRFVQFVEAWPSSDLADNALYQLGMLYCMTNRKLEAQKAFQKCLSEYSGTDGAALAAPQSEILRDELTISGGDRELFQAGRNFAAQGEFLKAKETFLQCLQQFPESGYSDNVYLSLSMVYSLEGRFDEARKVLFLILEKFPGTDAATTVPAALRRLEMDERFQ